MYGGPARGGRQPRGPARAGGQGRFRGDLFYRLARYELDLPPLRDRGRDAVLIARALLGRGIEGLPPRALACSAEAALVAHPWPGNVRELENALFRATLAARGPAVTARDLCLALGQDAAPAPAQPLSAMVLELVGASEGLATGDLAEALGVPRATLKRLLRALVDAGDLVAHGTGKAIRYHRPSEAEACLDPRERDAMAILDQEGRVSRQALADAAGITTRTAGRVLAGMVAAGLLVPNGRRGNAAGYVRGLLVAA